MHNCVQHYSHAVVANKNAAMEWQVVGYCLVPLEVFAPPKPVCKMSFKSKGCNDCRMRSCCDLAERNARLFLQGKVTLERFQELTQDLYSTCQIAGTYQDWLVKSDLPLTGNKRFHTRASDRRKLLRHLAGQVTSP